VKQLAACKQTVMHGNVVMSAAGESNVISENSNKCLMRYLQQHLYYPSGPSLLYRH
jgi:hypothetical protein